MTLKPPALPNPSTAGCPEHGHRRLLHLAIAGGPQFGGDRICAQIAAVSMLELIEYDVDRAVIRADGVLNDRLPRDRDGVPNAGDSSTGAMFTSLCSPIRGPRRGLRHGRFFPLAP